MPWFEFRQWRKVRNTSRRLRAAYSPTVVTSEIQRLELRALLGGMPVISISDVTLLAEGNSGDVTQANFVVELSGTSPVDVTANFVTQNGSAVSSPTADNGLQSDFNSASGI